MKFMDVQNGAKTEVVRGKLARAVGQEWVSVASDDLKKYGRDWLVDFTPAPSIVVRPRTVLEIVEVVTICRAYGQAIVPSGGRTGLSGGAAATNGEVILSLERMNTIKKPDLIGRTIEVESGAITEKVQQVAREHDLYFPVDFASKGSSHIGGNIATNAGGIRVVRYGNIRDWVVGLTVVTGTGAVLELNGSLLKNQTGYDLKNLVVGAEGTLAIIAGAVLQLTDAPGDYARALVGLPSLAAVSDFFCAVRKQFRDLSAFEYLDGASFDLVLQHHPQPHPLGTTPEHVVMVELEHSEGGASERLSEFLAQEFEAGGLTAGVVSASQLQADKFLRIRELVSATISDNFRVHKNDIAVPVGATPEFIGRLKEIQAQKFPECKMLVFGHIGDGNLHLNLLKPNGMSEAQFVTRWAEIDDLVFGLVSQYRGSISAEHGVGLLKKKCLHYSRSAYEIQLMREMKKCWDPDGIINPGKIF